MCDFNNKEMICYEKIYPTEDISVKPDITCEISCMNSCIMIAKQLITTAVEDKLKKLYAAIT